jgi:hypothetical protein
MKGQFSMKLRDELDTLLHRTLGESSAEFASAYGSSAPFGWVETTELSGCFSLEVVSHMERRAIITAIRLCVLCKKLSATRAGYKRPIFTATRTKPIVERMKQYPFIDRGLLQSQTVTLI